MTKMKNLKHNKQDGSYTLKSKTKEGIKGACTECGEDGKTRDLLYRYKTEDYVLVTDYLEEHLITYSTHESITPIWCDDCKALIEYSVELNNEKSN